MVATEQLGRGDCEQGAHPRIIGVRLEVAPKVVGCTPLSDGDEVLVAADSNGHGACFYAPLAGDQHVDGPCIGVRASTPLSSDGGVESLSVRKPEGDSGAYVGGVVPSATAHVLVRYRTKDSSTREWPASLLSVHERLAAQLGARRSFAYFGGEIPRDADTCRRLLVEARNDRAALIADDRLTAGTVGTDGAALQGSRDCQTDRATARDGADSLGAGIGAAVAT